VPASDRIMEESGNPAARRTWAVLLAAGDARRVSAPTSYGPDERIPRQFWAPPGEESLFRQSLRRATRLVPAERILALVTADHEAWWRDQLADLPPENRIVQPMDRGTAAAVLLPYLHILERDPDPLMLFLTVDHPVADEQILAGAIDAAVGVATRALSRTVFLGMVPRKVTEGCGWIVAAGPHDEGPARTVRGFTEKADLWTARWLAAKGGVINSMNFAATRRAMALLFARAIPSLVFRFLDCKERTSLSERGLKALYATLPPYEFGRDVLQKCDSMMLVISVSGAGWVDTGAQAWGGEPRNDAGGRRAAPLWRRRNRRRELADRERVAGMRDRVPGG
jgi:mannose-1-phosphate guanylyltransferase